MPITEDLAGQEQVDLGVRAGRCRHDLQPASGMGDARDFPSVAEDDGAVMIEPDDLQDLAGASKV